MTLKKAPLILTILDGWGYDKHNLGNPIQQARTPAFDMMTRSYPRILLQASGQGAGMSWGEFGNSEVGHLNLGAGRVVRQYGVKIEKAIESGEFAKNESLINAFEHAKSQNSAVHLIGLLTSGTVHANFKHILELLKIAKKYPLIKTYLHLFLDGKDSGLRESASLIDKLNKEIGILNIGQIVTVIGRRFAMDRDNHWDWTQVSYDAIASAQGEKVDDILSGIMKKHSDDIIDTNMPALILTSYRGIKSGDSIIFFNFREDSIRQLYKGFTDNSSPEIRHASFDNVYIVSMTQYFEDQTLPFAFALPKIINCVAQVISNAGLKQLHIAETQKYAHVTYFFNGLESHPFKGENDLLINSPKDIAIEPQLRSIEIAKKIEDEVKKDLYDFIVVNIANADVIAHTGNFENTVIAIEAADRALEILYNLTLFTGGTLLVTSDHGNAESMLYNATGQPESKHNDSPVPFILIRKDLIVQKNDSMLAKETQEISGLLGDVGPTILELMKIEKPKEMTGTSLLTVLGIK